MIIQHNMEAINANRQLGIVSSEKDSSTEKLSSGYRINRSADDAAGLSISEKMRKQIRGLDRASQNIEDGISYAQVADGALNEVSDMLHRINELSIQAANGTNSASDRKHINDEVQQLKSEMERIFVTTKFNEKYIWEGENPKVKKIVIGSRSAIAVKMQSASGTTNITNENYSYLPIQNPYRASSIQNYTYDNDGSFKLKTDQYKGVAFTWNAYNGNTYTSSYISWDKVKEQHCKFNLNTLLYEVEQITKAGTKSTVKLHDSNDNPMFNYEVAFTNVDEATDADLASALNNVTLYLDSPVKLSGTCTDLTNNGITCNYYLTAAAAYADQTQNPTTGYNYSATGNTDINPDLNASNGNFSVDNGVYTFSYKSAGLGNLTATASRIGYYSPSGTNTYSNSGNVSDLAYGCYSNMTPAYTDNNKDVWWDVSQGNYTYYGQKYKYYYSSKSFSKNISGQNTEDAIEDALKGSLSDYKSNNDSLPGLLSQTNGGASTGNGSFYLSFDINSQVPYEYGNGQSSNIVGEIVMNISVNANDTYTTIMNKIHDAMKSSTLLSLTTNPNAKTTANYAGRSSETRVDVIINDFKPTNYYDDIELDIHSGSESTDKIHFDYECLRLSSIGMEGTNTLTTEDALHSIDETTEALAKISAQRALFGAYQNRMEHAYNINKISAENTQSAESKLRDTDMAKEMVAYSNAKILEQAGQSVLAQSNSSNEGIISLIK